MKVYGTNLSIVRGDSGSITISLSDNDDVKIPLVNGDMVYFTVKLNTGTDIKLIQKVITVFSDGNAIIDIEPGDTATLAYKSYKYDIQVVNLAGKVTTIVPPSLFIVEPEITFD